MNVKVVKEKCIGCGQCVGITDEKVFVFDEDNLAKEIVNPVPEDLEEVAVTAMENCPTGAIVEEE